MRLALLVAISPAVGGDVILGAKDLVAHGTKVPRTRRGR